MLSALEVFTTVVVGVMVGVEFSVAFVIIINPILNGLPGDSGRLGRAHGGPDARRRDAGLVHHCTRPRRGPGHRRTAPARHQHGTGLVVTAGALLILSMIMSLLLLVPINNRGKTWTTENRPEDWKEQMNRWDRFHYVRVAVIIAALALLVAALA
ncbi:membrane protein [Streptomyces poonensis]|uniref:Membrane protein n=1 Tax=Streptomyces poonensis TaxID=68255 RepID=A0A918PDF6_9ACTN|nr:membrane protein [Streptomyces poonensis]GLJ90378.1 membrane protein [Streptomyces poonensis]